MRGRIRHQRQPSPPPQDDLELPAGDGYVRSPHFRLGCPPRGSGLLLPRSQQVIHVLRAHRRAFLSRHLQPSSPSRSFLEPLFAAVCSAVVTRCLHDRDDRLQQKRIGDEGAHAERGNLSHRLRADGTARPQSQQRQSDHSQRCEQAGVLGVTHGRHERLHAVSPARRVLGERDADDEELPGGGLRHQLHR